MGQRVSHGADAEVLDDVAVALRRQGDLIDDVGGRGSAHLEKLRAAWDGPDFEEFAKRWRRAHRQVDEAAQAIRAYAKLLSMESDDQRRSSSSPSGGTGDLGHRGGGGSGSGGGRDHGGPVQGIDRGAGGGGHDGGGGRDHGGPVTEIGRAGDGGGRDHGEPVTEIGRAGEAHWAPAHEAHLVADVPVVGIGEWEPADIGRPPVGQLETMPLYVDTGEGFWDDVRTGDISWTGPGRPVMDLVAWDPLEITRWDDVVGDPTWLATGDWLGPR